jgi:CheY-like chemotaxis protein
VRELIDNAIKFSAQDGVITICAVLEKNSSGQPSLVLQVRDEGIGIAAAEIPHIFEPFHQVDASPTRRYGGNGIGLALCHQLARHMGGTLSVSSTLGRGSTFTLSIPTDLSETSPKAATTAEETSTELRVRHAGKPILVVEDDRSIQVFIQAILELAGLEVSVANDGSSAIDLSHAKKFDLILMDLVMPGVSGIEATKAIRTQPGYATVPILAVTARAFEDDRDACLKAGIDAHIPKPISRELLLGTVLQCLDAGRYIEASPRVN